MTSPLLRKKQEGWLGLVLTAVLCLGFLFWWFRPAREVWVPHTTTQLVDRALAEPGLDQNPVDRLVIDFDLMETAILQARLEMVPESLVTAGRIADPVVQARTIRQLAQAQLNSDSSHLGTALTMCDRISDPAMRDRMKEEILLQIAMLGFADVVLPEAKTPLLRARLARRLAETDGQDTARTLIQEVTAALPDLPPDQTAAILPELAWTRVHLAIVDGPQQAFEAIGRLPASAQDELWLDLFRICFGRGETAEADSAAVAAEVTSPALRRQMELEAIQSNIPLRPSADILAELQRDLETAGPGAPYLRALIVLADAQRMATGAEAAALPLTSALQAARELKDPVERATFLAELAELLPDALLFEESQQALHDAADAARTVVAPDQRLPLLVTILRHAFNAGEIQVAGDLATEALGLAPKVKLSEPLLIQLTDFLSRLGEWHAALSLLPPDPATETASPGKPEETLPPEEPPPSRANVLDAIATAAAEDIIGYDPSTPPNRGEPLDRIRNRAITDEAAAAAYLPAIPAGYQRARATLAIAKGLLLPPMPSANTGLPLDPTGPEDLLPGQAAPVPVLPEDPDNPDR